MKKTLALALVAAMTISMASMTAFAKTVKYNSDSQVEVPEKVLATVVLDKKDMTKTSVPAKWKLKNPADDKDKVPATVDVGNDGTTPITSDTYTKLGNAADLFVPYGDETVDTYTVKFGDLKLNKYDNTATKTFKGWAKVETNVTENDKWKTDEDPTEETLSDDTPIELVALAADDNTLGAKAGQFVAKFATVGRIDTKDDAIAKNLENIEKAKNDKEEAEANKKNLEKWDEEHNATNNVVKPDDDGKTVVGTAEAFVTYMGGKWDNKDAQYYGNDDYCRHAAQVIGLGEGPGDMYDIYSVEAPAGFLKGKSARITLTPAVMKNPSDFDITVYHVEGWCKAKKVKDFKIVDNKIVLWGDSFSPYVVVYDTKDASSTGAKDASNPSTGDFSAVPVALLAAAALGATGFVAYKKRKAE